MKLIPKKFIKKANRYLGKAAIKLRKHLPDILVVVGTVASGAAVVTACVETTKIDPVLDQAKSEVDDIHQTVAEAEDRDLAVANAKKDLAHVYVKTGANLVKLYAVPAALEFTALACFVSGHHMMAKRNMELAAAYTALANTFGAYRKRVIDRYGEDTDYDLYHNTTTTEVVDSETGEVEKVRTFNDEPENYDIVFGPGCICWDPNPIYSRALLTSAERYMNDLLDVDGAVFENALYEELHMPKTTRGQVVGWVKDSKTGDGYVDLHIKEVQKRNPDGTVDTVFTMSPNVDGTIVYQLDEINKANAS